MVVASPASAIEPATDAPMRLEVSSENPLLLTQLNIGNDMGKTEGFVRNYNSGWSLAQLWASVPDDVKHNFGFVLHQGHTALSDQNPDMSAEWLEANVAEADALDIPIFILWDEGKTILTNGTRWEFLEHLYRTYPNFMGTVVSEQADTLGDLPEVLRISNLYGGFHVLGSLEETNQLANRLEGQAYWDQVTRYSQNFIFNPKNFHENFETVNSWTQGAWLSGVFDNWGPYFDGYPYYGCGFFDHTSNYNACGDRWARSIGETVSSMMMLDQWQNGATVFHLENQLDVPTTGSLYSPYFYQSILPALRYILNNPTPSKDDVIERTKIVFSETEGPVHALADSAPAGRSGNPNRTTFFSMYERTPALTAVQKSMWFYLRSSGQYGIIPRIPKLASADLVAQFDHVLTKTTYDASLQYGDARAELFDTAYPPISEGEAFVQRSGDNWLVYNTNDRDNFNQDAAMQLGGGTFSRLEMPEITPHTWAMVTEEEHAIEVLLDNYQTDRTEDLLKPGGRRDMEFNRNFVKYAYVPNPQDAELRTTTMRFDVPERPTLTISGYDRNGYTYSEAWDPNTRQYTLTVQHNGVVDIRLSTADHEAGWTEANADAVTGSLLAHEFVFDGTSVAWSLPEGLAGRSADISIDGVPFAQGVDLADPGTVFRATGLSNSVHVLRIDGVGRGTGDLRYVPSVEHSANDIETNDFNYGTAESDEDLLYGSEHWRVIDGRLKLVGYVFPFYGDTTVYNTNHSLENLRYDAKLTLVQGTSGALVFRADEDEKSGYHFRLDPSRTAEGRTGSANYSCSLMIDYGATALATCPSSLTLEPNREYAVSVTAEGNLIRASIDGQEVLSYTATGDNVRAAGYTGVRAPQMQSDAGHRLGQFVELDDVAITDLDTGAVVYESGFDSWADAEGWMTETPLVFDWHEKDDPRSSFTFPWEWETSGGDWEFQRTDAFTSGMSGTFRATADGDADFTAIGGAEAAWADHGGYDAWTWLRVTEGDEAGLAVRATDASNMYQARLDIAEGTVSFGRLDDGVWTELAATASPVELAAEQWTLVEIEARGPLFTVLVDGERALEVVDSTHGSGGVGVWGAPGASVEVDDARVIARTATPVTEPRPAIQEVALSEGADRQITGFDHVAVKTARTVQPEMPATVTARFSDGTKEQVAVSWPSISEEQLAVSTAPTVDGPSQGKFTVEGDVEGTDLTIPVLVTVMPNLVTPVDVAHTYTADNPTVPNQVPATGTFTDGTRNWTKVLYVRWDHTPDTSPDAPTTQTITGSIGDWPWQKVTATVTVQQPPEPGDDQNVALNKPVTVFGGVQPANATRAGDKMVDGSTTTGWYTGGANDGAFSDGTSSSTQGSLCSWAYVDLGADHSISSYAIQFGENVTNFGGMFNAPYRIETLTEAEAAAAGEQARNSSVCTRRSGAVFGPDHVIAAEDSVWQPVSTGTGTLTLDRHQLDEPVTARYVRVFTDEKSTAHRYGTAVFEFEVWGKLAAVEPTLDLTVTTGTRCIAGKAVVTVQVTNTETVPVDLTFETAYGTKSFTGIAPGKSAFHTFTTRLNSVPEGPVSVVGTATIDDDPVTVSIDAGHEARSCS
ncbi:glycosyl hydrolase family 98 C-terminal domain-containing protein [Agromyces silvae]|uniref:glycosyl hydrolase family 98 C-terminal domain-containing protein n=1 Tax=Agromyces silvae TaxID=3388266 RepID=UPI00280C37D2|nr:glycosyl hydrolase family 98 C-terminal domain-containing protein [Agromyces protaetiae]